MAVILRESTHAHDAMQAARGFVAVTLTKLTITKRQVAVALDTLLKDQNVTWAVHRFQRIFTFFRLSREHVFTVFIPVACFFP